jgi:tetratricopeptide (TPR) repeat protein
MKKIIFNLITILIFSSTLYGNEKESTKILNTFAIDEKSSFTNQKLDFDEKGEFINWTNKKIGSLKINKKWKVYLRSTNSIVDSITISNEQPVISNIDLEKLTINKKYIKEEKICFDGGLLNKEIRYIINLENKKPFLLIETYSSGASASADHSYSYEFLYNFDEIDCKASKSKTFTLEDGHRELDKKNYQKAFEIWESLAKSGDAVAQNNIALMYQNGMGVNKDYEKAKKLLEKSSKQGYPKAQYNLANLYYIEKDYKSAVIYYEKAAKQNHEKAKKNLKILCAKGYCQ